MPSRNTTKLYDAPAYYHVYNRGAGGQAIFPSSDDKRKFLSLIERHSPNTDATIDSAGYNYQKYDTEILAYCLMGNHFHLLLYQAEDIEAITQLMRSVSTAYSMYFNRKYKRHGHLFQSIFKASRITDESYLAHITRYIHMNPRTYKTYYWSSLKYYMGKPAPEWLNIDRIHNMKPQQYMKFLEEYEGKKAELETLKDQLAL